jgi:carboxypeptidase Taq
MTIEHQAYKQLQKLSRHAQTLGSINSLLHWDQETYMPPGGAEIRAEQLQIVAGLVHRARTGPDFRAALAELVDLESGEVHSADLNEVQIAAVKRWHHDWKRQQALPEAFVEEFALLTSQSLEAWKEARRHNAFNVFAPYLEKIITYSRRQADYIGYKSNPYDALLEGYEPDTNTAAITKLFNTVRNPIVNLLQAIQRSPKPDTSCLQVHVPVETQLAFGKQLLQAIGFDFAKGQLSLSTHPFCEALHPHDCRLTTRIQVTDPIGNVGTVLHEGGHALYETHLPASEYGSPLGEALSLGMHESQSRWWETYIGQSKPFWSHFQSKLYQECGQGWPVVDLDCFWKAVNKVEPSLIRVEADEVTYPLHVILRFELEQELINGTLKVADVPAAWNEKMQSMMGITPPNDSQGCLQDIHWSMGSFGYFPTYLLGNIYAAYLFTAFKEAYPDWHKQVAEGNLHFITQWLKENIHRYGRRYSSVELLEKVGKKPFTAQPYLDYLTNKYSAVYGITV